MSSIHRSPRPRQQGFVAILAVLAISMVVAVILKQSVEISATKASTGLQQSDSVAALAQAQNGTEIALQKLSAAFNANPDLTTACAASNLGLTTENTALNGSTGPASFTFVAAMASVNGYCKIRVKGTMRAANRTIETWVKANVTYGTIGFGTNPTLTLTNTWPVVDAIGIFNTGWGVRSSDGHSVSGGNVDCTDCQSTKTLWYKTLTGTGRDTGGAGNYSAAIGPTSSASYSHTLEASRNYAMVGHVLGGVAGQAPTTRGSLSSSNNNNDSGTSTSATVSSGTNWCNDTSANAVVIGVSAKGPGITSGLPDLSGKFTSAKFTYDSDKGTGSGPGISVAAIGPSKNYVHYPDANVNDGLSTPIAWGDVFVELYYFYQPPQTIKATSYSALLKELTLDTTYPNDKFKNLYLQPKTYAGFTIKEGTYISGNSGNKATLSFTTGKDPTGSISSSVDICAGICGFSPSTSTSMAFTFGKASGSNLAKSWVAGITCLKGVDDTKVKPVTNSSGVTVLQWHEVLSSDSALF